MDVLSFLKFWGHATTMSTTSSTVPHLVVETDTESDEEDSFFDLELTIHDFDNKENNSNIIDKNKGDPEDKIMRESKGLVTKQERLSKMAKRADDRELGISKTTLSLSPKEPISKRKVLPIEPISKPQSPIALLKSAPSFRLFMLRKPKGMAPQKTEETGETHKQEKKETKVFAVKLNIEEPRYSPTLSRDDSMRSHRNGSIKVRNQCSEETKSEKFSKDLLQKYLKLIKPLYVKVSKSYSEKMKFSEELSSASPMVSPSVASVSLRKEKQRIVPKHLGKSRSTSVNRSDDTLLQHYDGIQSAILHCKRSFNSRDSSIIMSTEGSNMHSVRNSLEDGNGSKHVM